jgi:pectinacetylesterase
MISVKNKKRTWESSGLFCYENGLVQLVLRVWSMRAVLLVLMSFFTSSLVGIAAQAAEDWETIHPGGETSCALGTPYSFHTRRADPNKVVVFFNGGGACWAGQTCDVSVEPTTYVPSAQMGHNDPRNHSGIFDLNNPANPVSDWSMVFVSYCTGDVHLGASDQTYTKPDGSEIVVRHRGHANAHAALDWMKENFASPTQVLVAGSSAGAVASPVYAGVVSKIYPGARVQQLGDGAGGYASPEIATLLSNWGTLSFLPDWAQTPKGAFASFNDFYIGVGHALPKISFAQYDAAHDGVQGQFQMALEQAPDIFSNLIANRLEIGSAIDGFVSYTAGGSEHTILRASYFYDYSVDGVKFSDWLSTYTSNEMVETVTCENTTVGCDVAPM